MIGNGEQRPSAVEIARRAVGEALDGFGQHIDAVEKVASNIRPKIATTLPDETKPKQEPVEQTTWVTEITMSGGKQRQLVVNSVKPLDLGAEEREILVKATEAFFAAIAEMLPPNSSLHYSVFSPEK